MLEIRNVSKIFNPGTVDERVALDNINLKVEDGEFVTIIGGNGSGKSTLMNIIAGVYKPEQGSIVIDGENITEISEHKRAKFLGRVFQDPKQGTCANMLIEENLAIAYRRGNKRTLKWGISDYERALYKDLLSQFDLGLEKRLNAKVGLLSGGQRQVITLLMASLKKPKLLLLDEHTAALDPKTSKSVLQATNKIVQDNHITTIMITHNLKDAIAYGNRLVMLHHGHIVYDVSGKEKENLNPADLLTLFED